MTLDPVAGGTAHDPRVEAEVRRAALSQLLKGGPLAEAVHVLLVMVVAALVWNSLPLALTAGWVGAVTAAAALRTWWRLGLSRRTASPEEALRGVRLTVAGVGLAWGFGAAAAIPALGLDQAALILVVLAGIVAGATGTLVGDRRSFHYLLLTALAPLPIGILLHGHSRAHLIATLLIVLFVGGMDRVHRRAYRTFVERVRAAVLLASSTQDLARQHAYLDALIASTPVAIAVLDGRRSIRSVNPAFETLFGYSTAEAVGASIDALIVPDSLRSESSDLEARARAGEIVRVEIERRRKDGRPIQVRLSAAAVKAAPEGGLVALYEDISDRKAAEQAMRAARELAERVARARSAFLANMSHEIRTPMNAVLGFVELVLDTELQVEQRRALELVRSSSEADDSMTRRYGGTGLGLAISRKLVALMGGQLSVTSEVGRGSEFSFTLRLPVERSAAAATPGRAVSLGGRRLLVVDDNETNRRILRDMLGAEGVAVHEAARADAGLTALRRAAAAGTPFDIAILDAQMPDQDGFELAAAVRADPDLAATKLLILTSAGQRGDGERCRQMGIQAYLTKPIARADLIEAVGTVLLEAPPAGAAPALITRHSIAGSRHTLRILLAEDNLVNQQVATAMLVKRGHQVDVVGNGREAVDAIGTHDYDLVLMDIQMPEMDGFAATQAIRALPRGRSLPIIALTAHALSGERERCLERGMTGYLAKPFKAHDLFAAIEGRTAATADTAAAPAPPVDLAAFRGTMREAGAEAAVDGILATFASTLPQRLEALAEASRGGEAEAIQRAAHAFRSAAATIGAHRLAQLLEAMEASARSDDVARAQGGLQDVSREAQIVLDHVRLAVDGGGDHG